MQSIYKYNFSGFLFSLTDYVSIINHAHTYPHTYTKHLASMIPLSLTHTYAHTQMNAIYYIHIGFLTLPHTLS